jgi:peptidyl-prolyl cis-trans isomerase A (cyclophilin A)
MTRTVRLAFLVVVYSCFASGCVPAAIDNTTPPRADQPNENAPDSSETQDPPQEDPPHPPEDVAPDLTEDDDLAPAQVDPIPDEPPPADVDPEDATHIRLETTLGVILIELDRSSAPNTVHNILQYVDEGFYDGRDGLGATIFHRVSSGFVVQSGGLTATLNPKATHAPIANEAQGSKKNLRGTVSIAWEVDPESATSQFLINLSDNAGLDFREGVSAGQAVFGRVVEGMEVVDTISRVRTLTVFPLQEVPSSPIEITLAELLTN